MVNWSAISIIISFLGFILLYAIWNLPPSFTEEESKYIQQLILSGLLGSYVLTIVLYLNLTNKLENLDVSPRGQSGSRLYKRCFNLKPDKGLTREEKDICEIIVGCRAKMLTQSGCPKNCPKFTTPRRKNSGTMGGVIGGGILGEIIAPGGGAIPGAILGALLGRSVQESAIKSPLQKKEMDCKNRGKGITVYYDPQL